MHQISGYLTSGLQDALLGERIAGDSCGRVGADDLIHVRLTAPRVSRCSSWFCVVAHGE